MHGTVKYTQYTVQLELQKSKTSLVVVCINQEGWAK
jgi:hypothetical protein